MKKLSMIMLLISTISFLFFACRKDVQSADHEILKATDFWNDYGPKQQTFSVNAATGGTITGTKGTRISIPSGAFIEANGTIVTEIVSLNLVEILTKKDILFSGVLTEANGEPLLSGGELLVEAKKQNGDVLRMNPAGQPVKIEVPAAKGADTGMKLFVRRERIQQPNQSNDNPLTWTPASYAPFGGGANSYVFNLPGFRWVNIDKFYSDPRPKTIITASPEFKDNSNASKVEVLLIFKDVTTVCPIPYNSGMQKFQSYQNAVPVGAEVIIVIIGEDSDGNIQFGSKEIIVTPNMHIDVAIGKTTKAMMDSFLATLK